MEQLIIPKLIYLFILITYLVDIVLILSGEILSWSLMGVEGLIILTKLATVKARKLVGISRRKRGEGGGESNWRWTGVTSRCTTEYTLAAWE